MDLAYITTVASKYVATAFVFICTFVLVHWIVDVLLPRRHLPPGPLPLPVLGNLLTLGGRIDLNLGKLGKIYGDIFTVYFGGVPAVILSNCDVIRDAFSRQGDAFSGRPNYIIFKVTANKTGIILSDGQVWKLHRKLILNLFRDYGVGKASFEHKVCEEANVLVKELAKTKGSPFSPKEYVGPAVANIICSVVYGKRFEYNDPVFHELIYIVDTSAKLVGASAVVNFMPWLRFIPGFGLQIFKDFDKRLKEYNYPILDGYLKNFDPNKIDGFLDSYIDALIKEGEDPRKSPELRDQITRVMVDFFAAGSETTATTLRWAILFLLRHPEHQTRIQAEIDDVVGRHGVPTMQHMRSMPFTEAFLCETQRIGDIVPLGLFHTTTRDVSFHGYNIPVETLVLANFTEVMMKEETFKNATTFDPERFLDGQGKVVKPDSFIPFSVGKRVCLGESLARMELFIITTILLQSFSFNLPDGHKQPRQDGNFGLTLAPDDYQAAIESRL